MSPAERFGCIREIDPGQPSSWTGRVFLTLDIDWAPDEVLSDSIDLIERADIEATWFITHDTPLLGRLRSNPRFELGVHPNFNFLLSGDMRNGATSDEVLGRLLDVVPEATAVRSHSMTQSSMLLNLFAARGLTHDCNHFVPAEAGIDLKPWRSWNNLVKVPYCWEDDIAYLPGETPSIIEVVAGAGLVVVDFHPIHVFLNTPNLAHYERARPFYQDSATLRGLRHKQRGTRHVLSELLERR